MFTYLVNLLSGPPVKAYGSRSRGHHLERERKDRRRE